MNYFGIDLGTTNSAICSFDGEQVRLFKSPEQTDVTPSAIFIDKRGNKYIGAKAYNIAAKNPDSAAMLFKRYMGSNTPINLPATGVVMTPEQCSAEIIRAVCGYVPEDVWNDDRAGTVVTVPAAFDQMQKAATMAAAELANVGAVALMQEPVAAVMSVVRTRRQDGVFVVFDLGGGTLDVAVAQCIAGRVSLIAHGGIAMCGGRDFDLLMYEQVAKPWLMNTFNLPTDLECDPKFRLVRRMALWAGERAKIELSQRPDAVIALSESEMGLKDLSGADIYLDIAVNRAAFDRLVEPKVTEAILAAAETLTKAGLSADDVERVVFVGGPTQYRPLRDRVARELGIAPSTDVNPMTAVAEGAAMFAESIDWSSHARGRKTSRGSTQAGHGLEVTFNYETRTPNSKAKVVVKSRRPIPTGTEFQIDSLDTGWSSGRAPLRDGATVELTLAKPGENTFKIFVFDQGVHPLPLAQDRIVVARTAATVDAIPASYSIGIEAREKLGGTPVLEYLVKAGDSLPAKGRKTFRAAESLKAGSNESLKFKLWEGEVRDPISSNRPIGTFKIAGSDFDDGVIAAGAELICEYEVLDSGQVTLEVEVPTVKGSFRSASNFYSYQDGQIDYSNAAQLISDQTEQTQERLDEVSSVVDDPRLDEAQSKLDRASSVQASDSDPEAARQAMEDLQHARWMIAETRQAHLNEIRKLDLDRVVKSFNSQARKHARPSEASSFDNLMRTAERSAENASPDFEAHLAALWSKIWGILWRQEWFVIDRFNEWSAAGHSFSDQRAYKQLRADGAEAVATGEIDRLRQIVFKLNSIRISSGGDDADLLAQANIVRS